MLWSRRRSNCNCNCNCITAHRGNPHQLSRAPSRGGLVLHMHSSHQHARGYAHKARTVRRIAAVGGPPRLASVQPLAAALSVLLQVQLQRDASPRAAPPPCTSPPRHSVGNSPARPDCEQPGERGYGNPLKTRSTRRLVTTCSLTLIARRPAFNIDEHASPGVRVVRAELQCLSRRALRLGWCERTATTSR